jgi:Glycosyl hydrolases family 39
VKRVRVFRRIARRTPEKDPKIVTRNPLIVALAVVVLAASMLLTACGGDSAKPAPIPGPAVAVQSDHLALTWEPPEPRMDMLAEAGVKVTRFDILWRFYAESRPANGADPADPAYNFDHLDTVMKGLQKRGITPIVSVYSAPNWATGGVTDTDVIKDWNSLMPDPEAYGDFMEAVSRRYNGRFVADDGSKLPRVRHWEVWNEPNLSIFFSPQLDDEGDKVSPAAYARLVRAAYPAIKRGGGDDTVVIAGVSGPTASTKPRAISAWDWLTALRDLDIPLDAYSMHIYPAAAPTVETEVRPSWSTLDDFLAALDAWRPGVDLYITEAGYTTAPSTFRSSYVTEDEQATYLRQIFSLPQVMDPRVRAIVWFNLQDNPGWPAGLMREDGSLKPSHAVFQELATREGQRPLNEPAK